MYPLDLVIRLKPEEGAVDTLEVKVERTSPVPAQVWILVNGFLALPSLEASSAMTLLEGLTRSLQRAFPSSQVGIWPLSQARPLVEDVAGRSLEQLRALHAEQAPSWPRRGDFVEPLLRPLRRRMAGSLDKGASSWTLLLLLGAPPRDGAYYLPELLKGGRARLVQLALERSQLLREWPNTLLEAMDEEGLEEAMEEVLRHLSDPAQLHRVRVRATSHAQAKGAWGEAMPGGVAETLFDHRGDAVTPLLASSLTYQIPPGTDGRFIISLEQSWRQGGVQLEVTKEWRGSALASSRGLEPPVLTPESGPGPASGSKALVKLRHELEALRVNFPADIYPFPEPGPGPSQHELSRPLEVSVLPVLFGGVAEFVYSGAYDEERHWRAGAFQDRLPVDRFLEAVKLKGAELLSPATRLTYYEATAIASYQGGRLLTRAEWYLATSPCPLEESPLESVRRLLGPEPPGRLEEEPMPCRILGASTHPMQWCEDDSDGWRVIRGYSRFAQVAFAPTRHLEAAMPPWARADFVGARVCFDV